MAKLGGTGISALVISAELFSYRENVIQLGGGP